jgi:hypothetical protein
MVKLNVDVENGGMQVDEDFLVDFGTDKSDVLLAHEMRCICFSYLNWLAKSFLNHTVVKFYFQISWWRLHIRYLACRRNKIINSVKLQSYNVRQNV